VAYLAGGVIIAVGLTVLNLLLTLGVIRRLREHTELLSARPATGPSDLMLGVGQSPESFTATTTDDEQISPETLGGGQLVGFFSPTCQPCKEKAPLFAEHAAGGGRTRALAVVVGGPDEVGELVTLFEPVARVVVESSLDSGSIAHAFKVKGFPAICTLDGDGVVTASGFDLVEAPKPSLVS
jgi:hypothetical protein